MAAPLPCLLRLLSRMPALLPSMVVLLPFMAVPRYRSAPCGMRSTDVAYAATRSWWRRARRCPRGSRTWAGSTLSVLHERNARYLYCMSATHVIRMAWAGF
eukprot:1816645-Rhodomonas_salina.3